MPSDSRCMSSRMDRRKTHMPDCESRTQRKYSSDMASDSTQFPNLCFKLMAFGSRTGKTRGVEKIHVQMQQRFQQIGNRVGRIAVIAIQRHMMMSPVAEAKPRL
jgi:hypothetical protein